MVLGNTRLGGTQAFILNLLRYVDSNRFQVDWAINFLGEGGGITQRVKDFGCNIYFFPYFKIYNYWGFVSFWRNFLREHHYDIIHAHSTNSASIYLKVAKEMGCVTIAHSHSAGYRGNKLHQLAKKIFARGVGNVADYWFACSNEAAERLYGKSYRQYPRYYDIPNAINAEIYRYDANKAKTVREQLGIKDDEFLCGHVGTFTPPKNHSFLLEIFREVLAINSNAKLLCCGRGVLMEQVKKKAAEMGIIDRIIFPGVVDNCNEFLMAMDVFVFPSLFEGFPVSVIEAEATGLPVIMSDVITKEVDLTSCIRRLSLSDNAATWAYAICNTKAKDRKTSCRERVCSWV